MHDMKANALLRALMLTTTAVATLTLGGCGGGKPKIDQNHLCVFSDEASAKKNCHTGDVALYAPSTFGNEQLPLMMIAGYCDTNAPIQFNKGGFVCRYDSVRAAQLDKAIGN